MGCLSKAMQGLCYKHSNFTFSKNLDQFLKNSDLRTKNSKRCIVYAKMSQIQCSIFGKKISAMGDVVRKV